MKIAGHAHHLATLLALLPLSAVACRPAVPGQSTESPGGPPMATHATPGLPSPGPATASAGRSTGAMATALGPGPAEIVLLRGQYQTSGEILARSVTGGREQEIAELDFFNAPLNGADVHPTSGAVAFLAGGGGQSPQALWVAPRGEPARLLAEPEDPADFIEGVRISPDGGRVAYAVHDFGEGRSALRVADIATGEDRLITDQLAEHVATGFRLMPLGWSGDGETVYLTSTTDSEATPKGVQRVDVASGAIAAVDMPAEALFSPALSPDGSRIAYVTWEWRSDEDLDLPMPVPPYRLRVVELATGATRTVVQSDGEQYHAPIWSPEGDRLLMSAVDMAAGKDEENGPDFTPLVGVDLASGVTWHPLPWLGQGMEPVGQLEPRLWLPGERVVIEADDKALHLLDLDDAWPASGDPDRPTDRASHWRTLSEAPAIEALGFRLPEGVAPASHDPLVTVWPADDGDLLAQSPDGRWRARQVRGGSLEGPWHRGRLTIEQTDGDQSWTAIDEYVPHAICGDDMKVMGWTAEGALVYARPGCGEGCVRFAGWQGPRLLDPRDGSVRQAAVGGENASLAPDGRAIAFLRRPRESEGRASAGAELVVEDLATGRERRYALPPPPGGDAARTAIDAPLWSPDSRHLALTELVGHCGNEEAARVTVLDHGNLTPVAVEASDGVPWLAGSWQDSATLRLVPLDPAAAAAGEERLIQLAEE